MLKFRILCTVIFNCFEIFYSYYTCFNISKFRILCGGKGGHPCYGCRGKKPGRPFKFMLVLLFLIMSTTF